MSKFQKLNVKGSAIITPVQTYQNSTYILMIGGEDVGILFAAACFGVPTASELGDYLSVLVWENKSLGDYEVSITPTRIFLNHIRELQSAPKAINIGDKTPVLKPIPDEMRQELEKDTEILMELAAKVHAGEIPKEVLGEKLQAYHEQGKYLIPKCDDPNCEVCSYLRSIIPPDILAAIQRVQDQQNQSQTIQSVSPTLDEKPYTEKQFEKFFVNNPSDKVN